MYSVITRSAGLRGAATGVRTGALLAATLIGGCASLPSNGPTASQIVRSQASPDQPVPFQIVDITPPVVDREAVEADGETSRLAALAADGRVDQLGPGDVLSVRVFEVGTGLFSGNSADLGATGAGGTAGLAAAAPTATGTGITTGVVVDREGAVTLPYIGRIVVAGLTSSEVQRAVERRLAGKSQNPQVLVTVSQNLTNTVVVMGAVQRPGRQLLTLVRERLLDAIASAGGISQIVTNANNTGTGFGSQDALVRFSRGARTVEQSLDTIVAGSPDDLTLLPGDRIELVRQPRTFIVFGATDRISQVPFESRELSLAEALARSGGPSDARADPRAVFLFRYARPAPGETPPPAPGAPLQPGQAPGMPIVYRLNMMEAQSYFLSQRFRMHDKDVIYIANARSNQPAKLVSIINLLFSPVVTAAAVARR